MTPDRLRAVAESLLAWAAQQRELATEVQRTLAPVVEAARAQAEPVVSLQAIRLAVRHGFAPAEVERLTREVGAADAETCLVEANRRAVSPRAVARERKR